MFGVIYDVPRLFLVVAASAGSTLTPPMLLALPANPCENSCFDVCGPVRPNAWSDRRVESW